MFCGNCGTQNVEGTQFCAGCGAPLGGDNGNNKGGKKFNMPKFNFDLKANKKLLAIGAGALALILVLVMLLSGGAKGAAKRYMKACLKGNFKKVVNMQPRKVLNEIKDEMDMDKDDWKDYIEDGQDDFDDYFENLEDRYGGKPKITFEITDQWSVDKDDDLFEEVQDEYDDAYDAKVSAIKAFEIELTMKAGGEKVERTVTIYMVKVGLSWYPYVGTSYYFF